MFWNPVLSLNGMNTIKIIQNDFANLCKTTHTLPTQSIHTHMHTSAYLPAALVRKEIHNYTSLAVKKKINCSGYISLQLQLLVILQPKGKKYSLWGREKMVI